MNISTSDLVHASRRFPAPERRDAMDADGNLSRNLLAMQREVAAASGELQPVLDAVVKHALLVLPGATGAIVELKEGEELVYRAASGSAAQSVGVRLNMGTSLSGRCIIEGRSLYCPDAENDPRVDLAACLKVGVRSMLVVPLHDRGEVVGVLKLLCNRTDAFRERDLLFVQLLTGPIAIGLARVSEADARAARHQADRRFLATFEQAAVGIAHVAPQGRFQEVNARFCEIAGYDRETLKGMAFQDITHEDDIDADLAYLRALTAGRINHYAIEKRYLRGDGTPVWVQLTVSVVRDGDGAPDFYVAVVEDIGARKEAERQSRHDCLTKLLNRRGLTERLERELGRGAFHRQPLLVVFLDLDGFKGVNDRLGHAAGDQCLQAVALNLEAACGPGTRWHARAAMSSS